MFEIESMKIKRHVRDGYMNKTKEVIMSIHKNLVQCKLCCYVLILFPTEYMTLNQSIIDLFHSATGEMNINKNLEEIRIINMYQQFQYAYRY